jgi:hypothetical protein
MPAEECRRRGVNRIGDAAMSRAGHTAAFSIRYLRAVQAVFFGFCALMFFVGIADPGKGGLGLHVFDAVAGTASTLLAVRGARVGVVCDGTRVTHRGLGRSRSWSWDVIDRFEARDGRVGMAQYQRRVLWVVLKDGHEFKLEAVNSRPPRNGAAALTDRAAIEFNAIAAARRA